MISQKVGDICVYAIRNYFLSSHKGRREVEGEKEEMEELSWCLKTQRIVTGGGLWVM